MVKLLGSLCVFSGGALAWWEQMAERRRKRDTLSDLLAALRRMAEEVRMARTPLPMLLDTLSQGCGPEAAAFFQRTGEAARRGEDFCGVWEREADLLPLAVGDKAALTNLGSGLHGDEESICKAISIVIYELAKSVEELEQRRRSEEKQATALCFSAAALLVILLI